ncbi:tetraspanin-7-like [Pristis pectinata]|uniref:tetraspanin-7-like n=1 Tax=Pristis pectinata TaxID=685728 RepID=UPI00223E863B|nr:tetraspanin-7-like [Pristis pectinata]
MTDELPYDVLPRMNLLSGRQESLELVNDREETRLSSPRISSEAAKAYPKQQVYRNSTAGLRKCELPAYSEAITVCEAVQCDASQSHTCQEQSNRPREESLASESSHARCNHKVLGLHSCTWQPVTINKGTMALLKLTLMAFSFVFWTAGLTMFTIGIWAKISLGSYLELSTNDYPNTPHILLAMGAAVILWGFLGCFSAATEHRCLLKTYGVFQIAVLIGGLSAGLSALFYRKDIAEGFRNGLGEAIQVYGEDEEKANAIDDIQRTLDCCGVESYKDWVPSPWSEEQFGNGSVPLSCCTVRKGCQNNPVTPDARGIYKEGCFKKIYNFVNDNLFYIAVGALGLAVVQVIGIVLACLLASRIPSSEMQEDRRSAPL